MAQSSEIAALFPASLLSSLVVGGRGRLRDKEGEDEFFAGTAAAAPALVSLSLAPPLTAESARQSSLCIISHSPKQSRRLTSAFASSCPFAPRFPAPATATACLSLSHSLRGHSPLACMTGDAREGVTTPAAAPLMPSALTCPSLLLLFPCSRSCVCGKTLLTNRTSQSLSASFSPSSLDALS